MNASDIALRRLMDIQAITDLKHLYCAYCDDNYDADGIASCYAEDGAMGTADAMIEGREAIRSYFKNDNSAYQFAIHSVSNPIIRVDGDHATGTWKLFQPCTMAGPTGLKAVWIAGTYSDTYVREGGQWLFDRVVVKLLFVTPYEEGWVQKPFIA